MNPYLLVKAFVSESVRVVAPILVRPLVGAIFKYAAAGDQRLYMEPDPPRNPGARTAPQSAQKGQQ